MARGRPRALCLECNAGGEEVPWGRESSGCRVLGKMCALTALGARPLTGSRKGDPDEAVRLRGTHPAIVPGWHMSKRHWNTVTVSGVPDRMLRELVEDSYDLVVAGLPRAERLRLDRP